MFLLLSLFVNLILFVLWIRSVYQRTRLMEELTLAARQNSRNLAMIQSLLNQLGRIAG